MSQSVLIKHDKGIVSLALNRPDKRNALNGELVQTLLQSLQNIASNSDNKVVYLYGMGEHFCAGADINWMQQKSKDTLENNINDAKQLANLFYELYSLSIPTIAICHGNTLGGGLGLLAACDIAIALPQAQFEFSEVKIGLIPAIISPYITSILGQRAASYYFLTGERFNAIEALQLGLIQKIYENTYPHEAGLKIAELLCQYDKETLLLIKQLISRVSNQSINSTQAQDLAEQLAKLRVSPLAQKKLNNFLEKKSKGRLP